MGTVVSLNMKRRDVHRQLAGALAAGLALPACSPWRPAARQAAPGDIILALMRRHGIPGMAVALVHQGRYQVLSHGLAVPASGQPVTPDTLFEVGSISKTFTGLLAAYAWQTGRLDWADPASRHLPALAGSAFDHISLLNLGTYTAGGLPLQFPGDVTDQASMLAYYRAWQPSHAPGAQRLYSNPSLGLFGHLAARSLGRPFGALMTEILLPMLDLRDTFTHVPAHRMADYAWGQTLAGQPIRVAPGVLDLEAYGIKTSATDMARYIQANLHVGQRDKVLQDAIAATHTGYYQMAQPPEQTGGMVQGLGWERYPWPIGAGQLLAGNSPQTILQPNEVTRLDPPRPPNQPLLINKTGSTNGFGAYVAFVPARGIGVALLANKPYPIAARVEAAHRLLATLDQG